MSHYSLRIVCRAKSHQGKEAIVGRLSQDGEFDSGLGGDTLLIDDLPVSSKSVHGGINSAPDGEMSRRFRDDGRSRSTFACPLCGLNVQMREDSLRTLMIGLIKAGTWTEQVSEVVPGEFHAERISSIGLESLAATM